MGLDPIASNFFDNITGNYAIDPPRRDQFKILKRYTHKMRGPNMAAVGGTEDSKEIVNMRTLWIPFKKKFIFDRNTGIVSNMKEHLSIQVLAYDTYGSNQGLDNIAWIQGSFSWYFRDI